MDAVTGIGTIGMLCLLTAFVTNLRGRLQREDAIYAGLNLVGSLLLVGYAWALPSYPFLVLELVWTGAAAASLWNRR